MSGTGLLHQNGDVELSTILIGGELEFSSPMFVERYDTPCSSRRNAGNVGDGGYVAIPEPDGVKGNTCRIGTETNATGAELSDSCTIQWLG
jgi:hypothetical protein